MTLKDEFADYMLYELGRSPRTVKTYLCYIRMAERIIGKPVESIDSDDLRQFKRNTPYSSQTTKGIIVAVRQFLYWGALEGHWLLDGKISLIKTPRVLNEGPPALPIEKVRILLDACQRPLEYRVIYLPSYAGTRIGESAAVAGPMWGEDGFLQFRGEKNFAVRRVPIHPDLERVKWLILASPPPYPTTLQRVKRRLEKRVGFNFVAQQLRKSFASSLYDCDVPDEVVGCMLGHTGSVTRVYAPVSDRRKQLAILKLPYRFARPDSSSSLVA